MPSQVAIGVSIRRSVVLLGPFASSHRLGTGGPTLMLAEQEPTLALAPDSILHSPTAITVRQLHSGRLTINDQPIRARSAERTLRAIFSARPAALRVLLVAAPRGPVQPELSELIRIARSLGVKVYRTSGDPGGNSRFVPIRNTVS
jgi:hypothetical protein